MQSLVGVNELEAVVLIFAGSLLNGDLVAVLQSVSVQEVGKLSVAPEVEAGDVTRKSEELPVLSVCSIVETARCNDELCRGVIFLRWCGRSLNALPVPGEQTVVFGAMLKNDQAIVVAETRVLIVFSRLDSQGSGGALVETIGVGGVCIHDEWRSRAG